MNPTLPIPSPDPLPLPAPVWLLQFLIILTLTLHMIPMNLVLGGSFTAAFCIWKKNEILARKLMLMLPPATAMTITLGIAPLLFLQVLYGQFFYTSTILMAVVWFMVVPILILAYYGFYYNYLNKSEIGAKHLLVGVLSSFLILIIGFIYTKNSTLMLTPQIWRNLAPDASTFGMGLNLAEPTLFPRYLHMVLSAFAVTGLFIAWRGHIKHGALQFSIATALNLGAGLWFLFSLPVEIRGLFLGSNPVHTAHLWAGVGFAIVAMMLSLLAINAPKPRALLTGASVCIVLTIALMVTVRHFVRQAYLAPHLDLASMPVKPMWDVFVLFAFLLVAGLGIVGWMISKVLAPAASKT